MAEASEQWSCLTTEQVEPVQQCSSGTVVFNSRDPKQSKQKHDSVLGHCIVVCKCAHCGVLSRGRRGVRWVRIRGRLLAFSQITLTNYIILAPFSMTQFPTCPTFLFQIFFCVDGKLFVVDLVCYLVFIQCLIKWHVSLAEGFYKLCC